MNVREVFLEHNMRLTPDAERYLETLPEEKIKELLLSLLEKKKIFVTIEDVKPQEEEKVIVIRSQFKDVPAKNYSPNFKIHKDKDITGKSRSSGSVEDFITCMRDRYKRISSIIRGKLTEYQTVPLKKINDPHMENEKVRVLKVRN